MCWWRYRHGDNDVDEEDEQSDEDNADITTAKLRHHMINRLVGLVVKASASRAEDPGFESHLRRDFFGVESYQ